MVKAKAKAQDSEDEQDDPSEDHNVEVDVAEEIDADATMLATPDEELETINQVLKLNELTVRPGLMRLPVIEVTSTEDAEKVVITVQHPVDGDIRLRFDKLSDRRTWDDGSELKRVLDWYGYTKRDMHALQSERLYVKYSPESSEFGESDWKVCPPPSELRKKV